LHTVIYSLTERFIRWLQLQFHFDAMGVPKLIKVTVTVTLPASRSYADLFIYLGRSAATQNQ